MAHFLDIEAVRSKYSDITVTAIPKKVTTVEIVKQLPVTLAKSEAKYKTELEPKVEITRIPTKSLDTPFVTLAPKPAKIRKICEVTTKEYAVAFAKLEQTKFLQEQLAMLSKPLPLAGPVISTATFVGMVGLNFSPAQHPAFANLDASANIASKYESLLSVIADMRRLIPSTYQGMRIPKERLMRDIGQARLLVRECLTLLESDGFVE